MLLSNTGIKFGWKTSMLWIKIMRNSFIKRKDYILMNIHVIITELRAFQIFFFYYYLQLRNISRFFNTGRSWKFFFFNFLLVSKLLSWLKFTDNMKLNMFFSSLKNINKNINKKYGKCFSRYLIKHLKLCLVTLALYFIWI